MPPKASSAAWPPRRSPRTTARKADADPPFFAKCTSSPKNSASPSSQNSANAPPPLSTANVNTTTAGAAATASPELLESASGIVTSCDNKNTLPKEISLPTGNSPLVSSNSETQVKTLIPMSGTIIHVRDESRPSTPVNSASSGPKVSDSDVGNGILETKSIGGDGHELKNKAGVETLVEGEKGVVEAVGSSSVGESGKRRVIKKRVKVVKKVVKRRVPKKVAKGGLVSKETEIVGSVDNQNDQIENHERDMNYSKQMEAENLDPTGIVSLKTENLEPNYTVSLKVENEGMKEIEVDSMEVEQVSHPGKDTAGSENMESLGLSSNGISSEVPFSEKNDGKKGERIQNQIENLNVVSVKKDSGDILEDQSAILVEEGAHECKESVKEFIENNGVGSNGGLALSAEMEALERRRRRRTEIFLGGLDKDTKEEDIRKVFEQVGKVTEVRLVKKIKTGKSKGFAFLRFSSAADAKKALEKYSKVEICGKQCGAQPVEGNDTIFLGNINRKWKHDDVEGLLKDAGIEKIDKVTLMDNPKNLEQTRGFAFVEFETPKDAQVAFNRLQKNDLFIKKMKIKVAWSQPLVEPDEKEMLKVKSIYAEYLPSLWDEEKVRDFFKRFGEIESITLAKNLSSSRRKDFAFVNYASRVAALACVEAFSHEQVDDDGSKVNVKVSLAKPLTKAKQMKPVSVSSGKEASRDRPKAAKTIIKVHEPRSQGTPARSNHEGIRVDSSSTTADELIQLLRQQASGGLTRAGSPSMNRHHSSPGNKRPYSALGYHSLLSDPRGLPRTRLESSHLPGNLSAFPHYVDAVPLPFSQQRNTGYAYESFYGSQNYPHFQTRERAPYFGHSGTYRRCHH